MDRGIFSYFTSTLLLLSLSMCSNDPGTAPPDLKSYTVRGVFLGPRLDGIAMRVDHEAIPGYMEAMTMNFKLEDPSEIVGLEPGDRIEFEYLVLVDDTIARDIRKLEAKPGPVIELDLSALNSEGLRGPPDGLVAVSYEFCIPDNEKATAEVEGIDPTVSCSRSPGRIGCEPGELLCIGHTGQAGFRVVLDRLAALPFVARIIEARFE